MKIFILPVLLILFFIVVCQQNGTQSYQIAVLNCFKLETQELISSCKSKNQQGKMFHYNEVRKHLVNQNYSESLREIDKYLVQKPNDPHSHYNKGLILFNLGDDFQALKSFDKAIDLSPRHSKAYFVRAKIYLRLNDSQRAIRDLKKAVKYNPNLAVAHYQLAELLLKTNADREDAINSFSNAYALWNQQLKKDAVFLTTNQEIARHYRNARQYVEK